MESSKHQPKPFTLVVGIDFSPLSDGALLAAHNIASRFPGSVVHAVHAVPPPYEEESLPTALDDIRRESLARVEELVVARGLQGKVKAHGMVGVATTVLVDVARAVHADLIVVGTHGRGLLSRMLMGSAADAVVHAAPCSVLVVRDREIGPDERIEPPRPGQDVKEHHPRARMHYEGPNEPLQGFGMGALSIRP